MSASVKHTDLKLIARSLRKVEEYLLAHHYRGYDPFDVLTSPVFRLPVLRSNKLIRFGSQQVFRRIPLNLRPLLGIVPGYNPVTLGICIQAYAYLLKVFPSRELIYTQEGTRCVDELERMRSPGFHGSCWGYDFDWEGRYARIPAGTPTVVATGFITNGLYQYYSVSGDTRARDLCVSSAGFVMRDLKKVDRYGAFCYSYSPGDEQAVLNATMKGARLLAQAYSITKDRDLLEEARCTARFTVSRQRPDGSWPYALGDGRSWSDNFHTAYVLDCLDEYMRLAEDDEVRVPLERGREYYVGHFFEDGKIPRYYDTTTYPVDATAGAQSILTLARFGCVDEATRVALWMIEAMQDSDGFFYYQKHPTFTNRIPYARWSNAWMFAALAFLLHRIGFRA